MQISKRIQKMALSQTLAMSQKSSELKQKGYDVINLSVGEPDFTTPSFIKEAAKQAIDADFSFYSPVPGYLSLRQAICSKLLNDNQLKYDASQIVCSNGAKQSVCNALMSLVGQGDEVIIPAPYWVSYVEMVKLADAESVILPAGFEQDFKLNAQQLEQAITPKTKVLIFCSPSNPTGAVYSYYEVEALVKVLEKYPQVFVIADEIYEPINYVGKHTSMAQFESIKDRVAIVNGVSKAYAMTGWRLGWMAAPQWLASACVKLQGQYTSGPSSIAQKAAEAAYLGDKQCIEEMRVAFKRRRDLVVSLIQNIKGLEVHIPDGAFYVFPRCRSFFGKKTESGKILKDANDLALYILEEGHVACVAGCAFGDAECLRFSYATSDAHLKEAFERVATVLEKLK